MDLQIVKTKKANQNDQMMKPDNAVTTYQD